MLVDKIYNKYYDATINKYVVIARVKQNGEWMIKRIPFASEEEMKRVDIGTYIK